MNQRLQQRIENPPTFNERVYNVAIWKLPFWNEKKNSVRNNNVVDKLLTRLLNDLFDAIYFTVGKHQLENLNA